MYGNPYSVSSVKIGTNSGASDTDAPGFNISEFSGLTPKKCKINIDFTVGRTNSSGRINLSVPLFAKRGESASAIGGTAVCINNDGNIVFYGDDTGISMKTDSWQSFSISIDTATGIAYLYSDKKKVASKYLGEIKGIDSLDFNFPNIGASAWYVDSIAVHTSDSFPQYSDSDINKIINIYFDGLETNKVYSADNVSYVNFSDSLKNVFKMEADDGLFGKNKGDIALGITNTSDKVGVLKFSSGSSDERYHALKLVPENPQMTSDDTYVFETQLAVQSLNCTKTVKASAYSGKSDNAELTSLIQLGANGTVSIFGSPLKDNGTNIKLVPKKWYDIKIVINPSNGQSDNKYSVYWDGRLLADNLSFNVNGKSTTRFNGFSSIEAGYNIKYCPIENSDKLSDGNYSQYKSDGLYMDNLVCSVYKNQYPDFSEINIMSTNPYYANTISDGEVFSYGQDVEKFLKSLNDNNIISSEFVSENGEKVLSKNLTNDGYLRIITKDGEQMFFKVSAGTDSYLLSLGDKINGDNTYNPDMSGYYIYEQPDISKLKGSALDVSSAIDMNAKSGKLTQNGEKFVDSNGNEVHFWGTNLSDKGCFPQTHEEAEKLADRISAAGFNLVRIHKYGIISGGSLYGSRTDGEFDETQLDKLFYLISELKKRNIYYYLDAPSRGIFDSDNMEDAKLISYSTKSISYFDEQAIEIMDKDIKKLFTRINQYTGMSLANDPNLVCIELRNEDSLVTYDFENADFRKSKYYSELSEMYGDWLKSKYGSLENVKKEWNKKDIIGSQGITDEEVQSGKVNLYNPYESTRDVQFTGKRWNDQDRFTVELMDKFYNGRVEKMKEAGIDCAVTCTTNIGTHAPLYYVNSKTDFIDYHAYWSHPSGGDLSNIGTRFDTNNGYGDCGSTGVTSSLKNDNFGLFGDMATKRIYGKPYFVGEWKVCPANPYYAEGPVVMASLGKLQGWNPIEFCYSAYTDYFSKSESKSGYDILINTFSSIENPVLSALWPCASIMYLRDVTEAQKGYYSTSFSDENNIFAVGNGSSGTVWPGCNNKFGGIGKISLVGKTGVSFSAESVQNDSEIKTKTDEYAETKRYTSVTNQISADTDKGIYAVNTDKSAAVCGFIGKNNISVGNISVCINNDYAAVMLASLDNNNIASSEHMLLTLAGNALNYGQLMTEDGNAIAIAGKSPIMVEQITGDILVKASGEYEVYPLTSSGERKGAVKVIKTSDGFKFSVSKDTEAMSFELVKKS